MEVAKDTADFKSEQRQAETKSSQAAPNKKIESAKSVSNGKLSYLQKLFYYENDWAFCQIDMARDCRGKNIADLKAIFSLQPATFRQIEHTSSFRRGKILITELLKVAPISMSIRA